MAVAYRAVGTRFSSSGATATASWTLPTRSAGDILIAMVCSKNNATHNWSGSGWTKIGQQNSGASFTVSWGWKLSDGTDALPSVSWTGTASAGGTISSWSGASPAGPLQVAYNSGTTSSHSGTDTTPSRAARVIYAEMSAANTALGTPTNFTEHNDAGSTTGATRNTVGSRALASGAASGTASATGAAAAWARLTFELQESLPALVADVGAFTLAGQDAGLAKTDAPGAAVTWNPSDKPASITLSNGNLTATAGSGQYDLLVRPTQGKSTGKWVFGAQMGTADYTEGVGLCNATQDLTDDFLPLANAIMAMRDESQWKYNGTTVGAKPQYQATGTWFLIAFDADARTVWISDDLGSTWYGSAGSANPASGTLGQAVGFTGDIYATITTSDGRAWTAAFSDADLTTIGATLPSGFSAYQSAGAASYTLTAETGVFTLGGQAAGTLYSRNLIADVGAFTLTGQAADTLYSRSVAADVGTFALAGQDASALYHRSVAGGVGTFTMSGIAAGTLHSRFLTASVGGFTLTGQDAAFSKGFGFPADAGLFTLSGQDVAFRRDYVLTAETGVFTLTGLPAALVKLGDYVLIAEAGNFTLTGQAATVGRALTLVANGGAFTLTGQPAATLRHRYLSAATGTFVLTGQAANLFTISAARTLVAETGVFNFTGRDALPAYNRYLAAGAGSFALAGQAAALARNRTLTAEAGVFTLGGQAAVFARTYVLEASLGAYSVLGQDARLVGPAWSPRPPAAGSWASATPSDGTWTPRTPAGGSWT